MAHEVIEEKKKEKVRKVVNRDARSLVALEKLDAIIVWRSVGAPCLVLSGSPNRL
jgi:hypothetical protein